METTQPLSMSDAEITRTFADSEVAKRFPPILTVVQAAELLQVRPGTVRSWFSRSKLESCARKKGGRIRIVRDRFIKWYFNDGPGFTPEEPSESAQKIKFGRVKLTLYLRRKTWWVRYSVNGQQCRYSLRTQDVVEAHERVAVIEAELKHPSFPAAQRKTTLEGAGRLYLSHLETEGRAKRTLGKYRKTLQRLITVANSQQIERLDAVNLLFVDSYRRARTLAGAAPKTLHNEVTFLKQIVNYALSRELILSNPMKGLKLKRPKPNPQPFWTADEVRRILAAAADDRYSPLYELLAQTGLRIGEAAHLTWEDIDFEQQALLVRPKRIGPKPEDVWTPKTGDQRVVPLAPKMLATLRGLKGRSRWVFTTRTRDGVSGKIRPINDRNALAHLKPILDRLGLRGHLHTFRHSFISHALIRGVPEAVVRSWVGHVDTQILKLYTHIADQESKRFMQDLFAVGHDTKHDLVESTPDKRSMT